jgi:hypothetical protein
MNRLKPIALAVAVLGLLPCARALAGVVPKEADICVKDPLGSTKMYVDPEKLIGFTLDANNVRRAVENGVRGADQPGAAPGRKLLFLVSKPCEMNATKCGAPDTLAVDGARGDFFHFLTNASLTTDPNISAFAYSAAKPITNPADFFDGTIRIQCVAGRETRGISLPPPSPIPVYVRGGADQLYILPESGAYSAVTKANLNFTGDGGTHKQTVKLVGVIGYPFKPAANDPSTWLVVPYAGINKNFTRTKGSAKSVTADTWNLGLSYSISRRSIFSGSDASITDFYVVRPDYLFNDQDGSRLGTLNLLYAPYVHPLHLNDAIPINGASGDAVAYVQTIAELHLDVGWYADRGSKPDDRRDYARLGPKVGLALINANPNLPLSLILTHLHLWGSSGKPHDIDYSTAALSWGLDAKRNASVDLTYSNGRREDTALREELWGIAIAAKY